MAVPDNALSIYRSVALMVALRKKTKISGRAYFNICFIICQFAGRLKQSLVVQRRVPIPMRAVVPKKPKASESYERPRKGMTRKMHPKDIDGLMTSSVV